MATVPHKADELNSNKLRAYLGARLPVVSSRLPEVRAYEPHVRIAEGVEGWIVELERAIADRSPRVRPESFDAGDLRSSAFRFTSA